MRDTEQWSGHKDAPAALRRAVRWGEPRQGRRICDDAWLAALVPCGPGGLGTHAAKRGACRAIGEKVRGEQDRRTMGNTLDCYGLIQFNPAQTWTQRYACRKHPGGVSATRVLSTGATLQYGTPLLWRWLLVVGIDPHRHGERDAHRARGDTLGAPTAGWHRADMAPHAMCGQAMALGVREDIGGGSAAMPADLS
jgi:hypothetical protein